MPYPRCVALICHWLTWFVPLGGYGVYEAFYGPQYGHGFEYGVGGAQLSLLVAAILATICLPGAITALLLLGKIEQSSAWRLTGLTILAAIFSVSIVVGIELLIPDAWVTKSRLAYIYATIFAASFAAPLVTILGGTKLGYIERKKIKGVCSACGYDLRGTYGPQCPECGINRTQATASNA